ncbi:glutamine amidotransferase [Tengunoibacter tsumagoiensis]|uniref:VWA domain-containing protein n=1 Tax=Tengunoibacter tsumagoiensis TaxID=2014871 RepID=A0A402A2N0_9CHLR|nr:glutamine amidotransferase [Tengunoibacter tsumagoiensis]GCE13408.1 VWA domain-containing protein [Tengunoibacter tsumagoiensis]
MFTFEQPLILLLVIPIGLLVYLTWKKMALPYGKRQRLLILISRCLLFAFLIFALAGAAWAQPTNHQATVFVGDISSSTSTQRSFIEQWISSALQHKHTDDSIGIVATGRNALVEQSVKSDQIDFAHFESTPDTNYTDLAAGLRLAAAILPPDSQRHIVLLTDGQQNLGDALQEAQILQQEGIRLDIVPLPSSNGQDARIDGLTAPAQMHTNEHFAMHIKLFSSVAQQGTLRLYLDTTQIGQQSINLISGSQELTLSLPAPSAGFHTYRVTLEAPNDAILQNNEASAFVNVQGAPRVLVIEGAPGSGQNIVSALKATNINVTVGTPSDVPVTLDGLVPYDSVILADVPAVALGNTRMQLLQTFVRDLGHGLVVSGGENSYGIGGYANTPLEQTLPVRMDIPQHKETPSIAVVLIVESLEEQTQINISKEAAKEVVNLLTPNDQVGISSGYGTLSIKMQPVTDKKSIDKGIDDMNPDDPPSYMPDFINAEQVLLHTNAKIKHVILLGDGDAFDSYSQQITKMANEQITVSTVATNANSPNEIATMQQIAEWGKGRFYHAENAAIIPQLLLQETERAAKRSVINERFQPAIVGNHSILTGIDGIPSLDGYIATTPKPAAQIVLVSHLDDPVLAVWQYGLGHVAAWTSDALGLWTKDWISWNNAARWWANVTTWSLPSADNGALTINGTVANATAQLTVDLPTGSPTSGQQQVQAHIIAPDLSQQTITLEATAPERWEGSFPASQVGAYLLQVTWQGTNANNQNGTSTLTAATGLVVPYSPEFHTQGTDLRFLKLLANAGGGTVLAGNAAADVFNQKLSAATASVPLTWLLLILAALLLPFDIAVRRLAGLDFLTNGYKWLLAHLRPASALALASVEGTTSTAEASLSSLGSLRARREQRDRRASSNKQTLTTPKIVPQKAAEPTQTTTSAKAAPAPEAAPQPAPKPVPTSSTTSRLVEAKRRRGQKEG